MRPITFTKTLAASSANNICLSQKPGGAGALTINGAAATAGVATLDTQRIVGITSDANDSGNTLTITGTDGYGRTISETVTGPNTTTVSSTLNYKTVTSITISGAAVGNFTIGTTGVGASEWHPVDYIGNPTNTSIACVVAGTVNYTVQHTHDDIFDPVTALNPTAINHASLAAQTATGDGNYAFPIRAIRVVINSGTGSVASTILQALSGS
jgi:hypothetical protein